MKPTLSLLLSEKFELSLLVMNHFPSKMTQCDELLPKKPLAQWNHQRIFHMMSCTAPSPLIELINKLLHKFITAVGLSKKNLAKFE